MYLKENFDEKLFLDFIYVIIIMLVKNSCVIYLNVWELINKFC